jgi:hypothetical protein
VADGVSPDGQMVQTRAEEWRNDQPTGYAVWASTARRRGAGFP